MEVWQNRYSLLLASNYRYFASQYAELAEDTPPVKSPIFSLSESSRDRKNKGR